VVSWRVGRSGIRAPGRRNLIARRWLRGGRHENLPSTLMYRHATCTAAPRPRPSRIVDLVVREFPTHSLGVDLLDYVERRAKVGGDIKIAETISRRNRR
jgi:hypothetical protein